MTAVTPIVTDESRKAQIGDLIIKSGVFAKKGVVTGFSEDGSGVTVDISPAAISKYHRYAITTGMSPEEKEQFNHIMDKVISSSPDVKVRIKEIQDEIERLRTDPNGRKVSEWLRNEQVKIIRSSGELPTVYTADKDMLRY